MAWPINGRMGWCFSRVCYRGQRSGTDLEHCLQREMTNLDQLCSFVSLHIYRIESGIPEQTQEGKTLSMFSCK